MGVCVGPAVRRRPSARSGACPRQREWPHSASLFILLREENDNMHSH